MAPELINVTPRVPPPPREILRHVLPAPGRSSQTSPVPHRLARSPRPKRTKVVRGPDRVPDVDPTTPTRLRGTHPWSGGKSIPPLLVPGPTPLNPLFGFAEGGGRQGRKSPTDSTGRTHSRGREGPRRGGGGALVVGESGLDGYGSPKTKVRSDT